MAINLTTIVSSKTQSVEINRDNPTVIIGERINLTGRKTLLNQLKNGVFEMVKSDVNGSNNTGSSGFRCHRPAERFNWRRPY